MRIFGLKDIFEMPDSKVFVQISKKKESKILHFRLFGGKVNFTEKQRSLFDRGPMKRFVKMGINGKKLNF